MSTSRRLNDRILDILVEMQAIEPLLFDVRERSCLADYYIIAGANSVPHLRQLGLEVPMRLKRDGIPCHIADADAESGWIVLDYLDTIVHLMLDGQRRYYALEDFWREPAPGIAANC